MTKSYSYVVARDYGFAPNPFNGILTLAAVNLSFARELMWGVLLLALQIKRMETSYFI